MLLCLDHCHETAPCCQAETAEGADEGEETSGDCDAPLPMVLLKCLAKPKCLGTCGQFPKANSHIKLCNVSAWYKDTTRLATLFSEQAWETHKGKSTPKLYRAVWPSRGPHLGQRTKAKVGLDGCTVPCG